VSNQHVLHLVRPYATSDDYLAAEAWTINLRTMVLLEAPELPVNAVVLFDLALSNGDKLIRAEGKVLGTVAAEGDRPGGLRIRFKRYGGATKAFIERAASHQKDAPPTKAREPENNAPEPPPQPEDEATPVEAAAPDGDAAATEAAAPEHAVVPPLLADTAPDVDAGEPSGVHRRPVAAVDVPEQRDALLSRLRARAAHVDFEAIARRAPDKTG
jgi:hypothetical protein